MKAIVLVNAAAGSLAATSDEKLEGKIVEALGAFGVSAEVRRFPSDDLRLTAAQSAHEGALDLVIGAGGDGTLSAIASGLAGTNVPLGVLPLGTLNHFAKDLHIPLDLAEAAKVIAEFQIASVDVGQVNDRIFINNSSVGMYPRAVLDRQGQRAGHGWWKWVAMMGATVRALRRFPLIEVSLTIKDQATVRKTPLVFVGNNCYQLDLLKVGTRNRLDQGELSLYVANTQTRWGMLKLAFRAAVGRLEQSRDFESRCLPECWINTRRHRLHVALDGEVVNLSPPLHYRVWPKALRICVPPKRNS